jgi:hypothetical protein
MTNGSASVGLGGLGQWTWVIGCLRCACTHSPHRQRRGRAPRVGLNLLPQTTDVDIHRAGRDELHSEKSWTTANCFHGGVFSGGSPAPSSPFPAHILHDSEGDVTSYRVRSPSILGLWLYPPSSDLALSPRMLLAGTVNRSIARSTCTDFRLTMRAELGQHLERARRRHAEQIHAGPSDHMPLTGLCPSKESLARSVP